MRGYRIFILSPAKTSGRRADVLLNKRANFDLARRFHSEGATIGEVMAFMSGLYFRGKLLYSLHFSNPYRKIPGAYVITSNRGIIPVVTTITPDDLRSFGGIPIDIKEPRYLEPLKKTAMDLSMRISSKTDVILLGSIGTKKYAEPLINVFDDRLKFPIDFVGRGDMSRGGLLLRCVEANQELEYVPVAGAIRHGKRPPKLPPKKTKSTGDRDQKNSNDYK